LESHQGKSPDSYSQSRITGLKTQGGYMASPVNVHLDRVDKSVMAGHSQYSNTKRTYMGNTIRVVPQIEIHLNNISREEDSN
jgi:hypothetical protein